MCLEVRYTHKHRQQHWHAPWPNIIKLTHLSSWHIWLAGSQTEVRHYSVPSMVGALFCCHQQRNIVWTDVWIFWWADKNTKKCGRNIAINSFCILFQRNFILTDVWQTGNKRQKARGTQSWHRNQGKKAIRFALLTVGATSLPSQGSGAWTVGSFLDSCWHLCFAPSFSFFLLKRLLLCMCFN